MVVGEVEAVAAWLFLSQTFAQAQTPMEPGLQAHPTSLLGAVRGSGGPLGVSDLRFAWQSLTGMGWAWEPSCSPGF